MGTADLFRLFYEHFFMLISGDSVIGSLVDVKNIAPSGDVVQPEPGPVIFYFWENGQRDLRQKRATGTFNVTVTSPDNKIKAFEILDRIIEIATPRALTDISDKVIIPMFLEDLSVNDEDFRDRGVLEAATQFTTKLVPR